MISIDTSAVSAKSLTRDVQRPWHRVNADPPKQLLPGGINTDPLSAPYAEYNRWIESPSFQHTTGGCTTSGSFSRCCHDSIYRPMGHSDKWGRLGTGKPSARHSRGQGSPEPQKVHWPTEEPDRIQHSMYRRTKTGCCKSLGETPVTGTEPRRRPHPFLRGKGVHASGSVCCSLFL